MYAIAIFFDELTEFEIFLGICGEFFPLFRRDCGVCKKGIELKGYETYNQAFGNLAQVLTLHLNSVLALYMTPFCNKHTVAKRIGYPCFASHKARQLCSVHFLERWDNLDRTRTASYDPDSFVLEVITFTVSIHQCI